MNEDNKGSRSPVVEKIVQETLGMRLDDLKVDCGWKDDLAPNEKALDSYWERLQRISVLGSGAFLITALRLLLDEYHAVFDQRRRFQTKGAKKRIRAAEDGQLIKDILAQNLYGVDINPSSVEITKLALWLHTARPGEKLSALDTHIHDGNSLIDDTFYLKQDLLQYAEEERERINAFNWWEAFPEIEARGGFDVVIGNPPYVKFQNFRKVHADMAEYLREGRQGESYYRSTKTQNFDLYIPFVEKAISLLADKGRMGFIAPNLWTVNDYGENLRALLSEKRQMDRWVDFKSYQVFEEATIYTALQFFTAGANESIRISPAPDGDLTTIAWDNPNNVVPYEALPSDDTWLLLPEPERRLIEKMRATCRRLDDPSITGAIYQGLITSADSIYHLVRVGTDRYLCKPKGQGNSPYEVTIEDDLMHPLVSGSEAKRYLRPETETYILFPYEIGVEGASLIAADQLESEYPNALRHLKSYEDDLRARESGKFDDEGWCRFGLHQNMDKQEIPKLLVPRLVASLAAYVDEAGEFYLDNVDVGGVGAADGVDPYFLVACLNGPVANWVFRRISKPFRGDYRSANKQYIAPLPIPNHSETQREQIASAARNLQEQHSAMRDLQSQLRRRLESAPTRIASESWVFPDVGTMATWEDRAPNTMDSQERASWARDHNGDLGGPRPKHHGQPGASFVGA